MPSIVAQHVPIIKFSMFFVIRTHHKYNNIDFIFIVYCRLDAFMLCVIDEQEKLMACVIFYN